MKNAAGKTAPAQAVPAREHAKDVLKPALQEHWKGRRGLKSMMINALTAAHVWLPASMMLFVCVDI